MAKSKIPGLSFSWKRALGITKMKRKISKATKVSPRRLCNNGEGFLQPAGIGRRCLSLP